MKNISVRLALGNRNSQYAFVDYNITDNTALNPVLNSTLYTNYGISTTVNGSLIDYIVYRVTGAKQFDWMQLNTQLLNQTSGPYEYKIFWDLPWTGNTLPTLNKIESSTTQLNTSIEFGTYMTSFYVLVEPRMISEDINVIHNLWIGGYDITVMRFDLKPSDEGFNWLLLVYIGVPIIVAGVVVGIMYKKKHPF
jgi:hypothetical protein